MRRMMFDATIAMIFTILVLPFFSVYADAPPSQQAQQVNPQANNPYQFVNQLGPQNFPEFSTGINFYQIIGIAIGIFGVIFCLILISRYRQMQMAYVGSGHRISGRYRIFITRVGWIDCRLTEVPREDIEECLEIIKQIDEINRKPNFVVAIDKIIKKVKEGKLFLYETKVISRRNMKIRGNLGYSMILSSNPLDDKKYYFESRTAIINPFSPNFREHPRIVNCISKSKIYPRLETAERQRTTFYVVAPIPDPFDKTVETFAQNLEEWSLGQEKVEMKVEVYDLPKDLAEVLLIMRGVADTYKTTRSQFVKADIMKKTVEKLSDQRVVDNMRTQYYKSGVGEAELVKLGETIIKKMTEETWIWFAMAMMGGVVGAELPSWIPALSQYSPAMFVIIIDAFLAIIKLATQQQKKSPYDYMEKEMRTTRTGSGGVMQS